MRSLFEAAGCAGQLCVQSLDGSRELAVDADQLVVTASVFKVGVALVAETQFAQGQLDPRERITLAAADRTPGPVGFSLFQDDVTVSLRDLVSPMLTISDNVATDALLDRIGIDTVNARMAELGLPRTVIASRLHPMIDSIGRDAGFADWAAMGAWADRARPPAELDGLAGRILAATALQPSLGTRTTPRETATLLRLIWADRAGPPDACRRVRDLMRQQLTRHRLATGFPPPATVSAKSGGLIGVIRNEAGVVQFPDGQGYAVAVFTQAHRPWQGDAAINTVIGTAAATAVNSLRAGPSSVDSEQGPAQ